MESNKTGLFLGIAAFVVLLIIGALVLANKKPKTQAENMPKTSQSTSPLASDTKPIPAAPSTTPSSSDQPSVTETGPRTILIQNSNFTPATLTVKKGTTITWTNQDSVAHTITSDNGNPEGAPSSPTLNQGQQYSFTFNNPGTYTYHSTPSPNMHGTVVVIN